MRTNNRAFCIQSYTDHVMVVGETIQEAHTLELLK